MVAFERVSIKQVASVQSELTVNLVTPWGVHCGIATYSAFLVAELRKRAKIRIVAIPDRHSLSPYFFIMGLRTGKLHDLVHVEFAPGTFSKLRLGKIFVPFSALLFYIGLAFGDRPVITTFHEIPKTFRGAGIFNILLNRIVCQVTDLAIVHNLESKELIEMLYGAKDSKIKVIPHGCYETPLFLSKDYSKKKLGFLGKTVITIPGFIVERKGYDIVLSLVPQLDSNIHLVFAGEPQTSADKIYCEKLKALAKDYNCSDRVTFTGYSYDLSTILNATDIAILPYRSITDSGILRLLVAFQIPTITSNLKAFKEIEQQYGCIELFQNGNSKDLLRKLAVLFSNDEKRRLLMENCEKMWADTKWSRVAEEQMNAYLEALKAS